MRRLSLFGVSLLLLANVIGPREAGAEPSAASQPNKRLYDYAKAAAQGNLPARFDAEAGAMTAIDGSQSITPQQIEAVDAALSRDWEGAFLWRKNAQFIVYTIHTDGQDWILVGREKTLSSTTSTNFSALAIGWAAAAGRGNLNLADGVAVNPSGAVLALDQRQVPVAHDPCNCFWKDILWFLASSVCAFMPPGAGLACSAISTGVSEVSRLSCELCNKTTLQLKPKETEGWGWFESETDCPTYWEASYPLQVYRDGEIVLISVELGHGRFPNADNPQAREPTGWDRATHGTAYFVSFGLVCCPTDHRWFKVETWGNLRDHAGQEWRVYAEGSVKYHNHFCR